MTAAWRVLQAALLAIVLAAATFDVVALWTLYQLIEQAAPCASMGGGCSGRPWR